MEKNEKEVLSVEDFLRTVPLPQEGIDYVKCQICGDVLTALVNYHIRGVHGMTIEEYKQKFPNSPTRSKNRKKYSKKYVKKYFSKLKNQAIAIHGEQCEFQEQTLEYGGKKWKFCTCSVTDLNCLTFHHIDGKKDKSEFTLTTHSRIIKHGRQDDLELLCGIHHRIADIRDGTVSKKGFSDRGGV